MSALERLTLLVGYTATDHLANHFEPGADHDDIARAIYGEIRGEVITEVTNPAHAATIYADRPCTCDDTPHPKWCPASVPTDARIKEIRQGLGGPLTARELACLDGVAGRHELHVIGSRGGHWPLTEDLPGALLLVSQYLAAAAAVIERAGIVEEDAAPSGEATQGAPDLHGVLLDSVRAFRLTNDAPLSYNQQLANHILTAVAPLVPYREIWDSGLPPGGLCCSVCGQPVESEPCPEHAPDYRTAVTEALRLLEAAPEAFQAAPSQNITAAAGVLRRAYEAGEGQ